MNIINRINLLKDYTFNRLGNMIMDFFKFNLLSFGKVLTYLN